MKFRLHSAVWCVIRLHMGTLTKRRPVAIDLFAGAGGMSLGFEQAGFDVAAAVEVDPVHAAVHKFNFPATTVLPRSVVGLTAQELRRAAGIGDRQIDCVFGGPPCQGFSLIGHRVLDDPRNRLVLEFVRLVSELDAKTFVFENVKGLTFGAHRQVLDELVCAFKDVGYEVNLPWAVLNAANYGVPQHRERLILLGAQAGKPLPAYPKRLTVPADAQRFATDLSIGPTCADALADLPDAEQFHALLESDSVLTDAFGLPSGYASELRCKNDNGWRFGHKRAWKLDALTGSTRTEHSAISRRRFAETSPDSVEPISRFYKLSAGGLSNTLRAGTDGARGAFTSPRPIHYFYPRCITVRGMARLHGFPDWFRLHATKWHGARQVGNAVPPPLARSVAAEVILALGVSPTRPRTSLALGDPGLLQLTTAQAAAHFSVEAPLARRDRKSGARKRKQADIEVERLKLCAEAYA